MTKIEWVKNPDGTPGKTLNPVAGCHHVAPECKNCYAEAIAYSLVTRYGNQKYAQVVSSGRWNSNVVWFPEVLNEPRKRNLPTTYFVGDMSDIAQPKVREEWLFLLWEMMQDCPNHIFLLLTKHIDRLLAFVSRTVWYFKHPLENIWIGTTAGCQESANLRIPELSMLRGLGYKTFISAEPLLEEICFPLSRYPVDWIIFGGESQPRGREARPCRLEWIESGINQCQRYGVSAFVKQLGYLCLTTVQYEQALPYLDDEVEELKARFDLSWLAEESMLYRYVLSNRKGGGELIKEWPDWAQVRSIPYLHHLKR